MYLVLLKVGSVRGVGGSWGPGGFSEPRTHMYTCTRTSLCSLVAGICGQGSPAASHQLPACSLVLFAPRPHSSRNKLKSERYGGISAFSSNRDHPNCAPSTPREPRGRIRGCRQPVQAEEGREMFTNTLHAPGVVLGA